MDRNNGIALCDITVASLQHCLPRVVVLTQKTGAAEEAEEVESRMLWKRVAATDSQTQSVDSGRRRVAEKRELGAET